MNEKRILNTGVVRISFPHLHEAYASKQGDEPKFSALFFIDKSDKETADKINAAIAAAIQDALAKKFNGRKPTNYNNPLKDGDVRNEERCELDQAYAGKLFINASSKNKPIVVDCNREVITDPEAIKGGDYVIARLNFYAYNNGSNKGVKCELLGVQYIKEGERFGTIKNSADDFDIVNPDDLL